MLIVIGINESGKREILAVEMGNSEDEQEWSRVFQGLKNRGLKGEIYAVSNAHKGPVVALKREFQGASWQRCQVHFMHNFMSKLSPKERKEYVPKLKDVFAAPEIT